jgi:hypothetical protein
MYIKEEAERNGLGIANPNLELAIRTTIGKPAGSVDSCYQEEKKTLRLFPTVPQN